MIYHPVLLPFVYLTVIVEFVDVNDNQPAPNEYIIGEVIIALTFVTPVGIDMSLIFAVPAEDAGEQKIVDPPILEYTVGLIMPVL